MYQILIRLKRNDLYAIAILNKNLVNRTVPFENELVSLNGRIVVDDEQVAFVNVPTTKVHYDSLYRGSDTEKQLTLSRSHIYSSSYQKLCESQSSDVRFNKSLEWFDLMMTFWGVLIWWFKSLEWFDLMTRYLAILKTVRSHLSNETIYQLNDLVIETKEQVFLAFLNVC